MKVLFSNSDLTKQLKGIGTNSLGFHVVLVDRPFEIEITRELVVVSQSDQAVNVTRLDTIVFLLFREPHELIDDQGIALQVCENFALLSEACDMLGADIINHPDRWKKAYSKVALFRLGNLYKDIVPTAILLSGGRKSRQLPKQRDWIAKSGFGIKRPAGGLMPRYGIVETEHFEPSFPYRYLLQRYINSEAEFRVYVTRSDDRSQVTILEMPTGTRSAPDWRDTTVADELDCRVVQDRAVSELALEFAVELRLQSVSFDFVRSQGQLFLLDINPHGSWYWLPDSSRALIERQILQWLGTV